MSAGLPPLNYAIIKLFMDGKSRCAEDVAAELAADYQGHRLLAVPAIDEALMTAKENGLLDEARFESSDDAGIRVFYRMTDYGRNMVNRYLV